MKRILRLEWKKDPEGYELCEREWQTNGWLDDDKSPTRRMVVVPKSGHLKVYADQWGLKGGRVTRRMTAKQVVLLQLANTRPTPDGVLAFASSRGLLLRYHLEADLSTFYQAIADLQFLLETAKLGDVPHLARSLKPMRHIGEECVGSDGTRVLRAHTLLMFCREQLVELVQADAKFHSCEHCNGFFVRGRDWSRFCGKACQSQRHRHKDRSKSSSVAA